MAEITDHANGTCIFRHMMAVAMSRSSDGGIAATFESDPQGQLMRGVRESG